MKARTICPADILLLRKLLLPGSLWCIVNQGRKSGYPLALTSPDLIPGNFDGLVFEVQNTGLSIRLSQCPDPVFLRFDYINNPDGSIRWIFPVDGSPEPHLALYNSNTRKAGIYRQLTRLAWKFGKPGLLSSGTLYLQQKLVEKVKHNYGIQPGETFSLFTGTRGETRKVVISLFKNGQPEGFIKIPMTPHAANSIQNENEMVIELGKYDLSTLSLPRISARINGHARLSNIRPGICIPADRITAIHIRAMAELYALNHERKAIADTSAWENICRNMEWLNRELVFVNDINRAQVDTLLTLLKRVFSLINAGESVAVSVSHGDFTPWNMYCDEQRLYVYDWEMAQNGIPMGFDLFHFSYQSTILQEQKDHQAVSRALSSWARHPLTQQMIKKYKINLELHHTLYLLFTVSHYLRQYLCEKELLMQSQWMLNAWTPALNDCLLSIQNKTART